MGTVMASPVMAGKQINNSEPFGMAELVSQEAGVSITNKPFPPAAAFVTCPALANLCVQSLLQILGKTTYLPVMMPFINPWHSL